MKRNWKVSFWGREIHHPVARVLVTTGIILWGIFILALCLLFLPVWWPLGLLLKRWGRRGFWSEDLDGFSVHLTLGGFRRV